MRLIIFPQAGPLEKIKLVTDRETNKPKYAFITFNHAESVPYTIELMNATEIYGKPLRLQTRPGSSHNQSGNQMPASPAMQRGGRFDNHSEMARTMSAPDHIQRYASDMHNANGRMMQLGQHGGGLANPLAAQSMLSSGNHFPTKEAQRQRVYNQHQLVEQQQQQQLVMQQRYDWIMQQQQQQQMGRRQQPRWY